MEMQENDDQSPVDFYAHVEESVSSCKADCGYTSCSTTTEECSTSSEMPPFMTDDLDTTFPHGAQDEQQHVVIFDKDDEAACDDLLMDILSGDGDADVSGDGFLSLLTDDCMPAASPVCGSTPSKSFVKEEMTF